METGYNYVDADHHIWKIARFPPFQNFALIKLCKGKDFLVDIITLYQVKLQYFYGNQDFMKIFKKYRHIKLYQSSHIERKQNFIGNRYIKYLYIEYQYIEI